MFLRYMYLYAIFHSHLQYCCQIWGQPISCLITKINILQNRAIRLMCFTSQRNSATPYYAKHNIIKFCDIVYHENIIFLHKLLNCNIPISVHSTYNIDFTHAYQTRESTTGLFGLPSVLSTSFGKNSIRYQAISSWNKIKPQCNAISF